MNMWWTYALLHLIVGYPIYHILGTIRHELSHVVAYWLAGYGVQELHLLPFRDKDGTWYWGRAVPESRPGAKHSIHMHVAPYYTNVLLVAAWTVFTVYIREQAEMLLGINVLEYNLLLGFTILLLISPIVDTGYNLYKLARLGTGDFARAQEYNRLH